MHQDDVKSLHSRFVDWAQSFQSNRLEPGTRTILTIFILLPVMVNKDIQCGVLGLFSGRRHLSCGASWGCRGRNVGVCQRSSDWNIPCERQTSLPGYQRQTIRAFAVTTKQTRRFLRDWNFGWGKGTWNDVVKGVVPCDASGCHFTHESVGAPYIHLWPTPTDMCMQRRDADRAAKPPPLELPHRQDGDMRRLAVLTANHRYVWRLRLRKLLFATGHFCCFRLSHRQPGGPAQWLKWGGQGAQPPCYHLSPLQ